MGGYGILIILACYKVSTKKKKRKKNKKNKKTKKITPYTSFWSIFFVYFLIFYYACVLFDPVDGFNGAPLRLMRRLPVQLIYNKDSYD